jgi:hypothetical protein
MPQNRLTSGMGSLAGILSGHLEVGSIRTDFHFLTPSDLAVVTDIDLRKYAGVLKRCKYASSDRLRHVDASLGSVGKPDSNSSTVESLNCDGSIHSRKTKPGKVLVKLNGPRK